MNKRCISSLTETEYNKLKSTGYLWEFYPSATGNYKKDISI